MKKPDRRTPQVKKVKPFFWRRCFCCHNEFKQEVGYKVWRKNEWGNDFKLFICSNCADSSEKARSIILEDLYTKKCGWCGKPEESPYETPCFKIYNKKKEVKNERNC